MSGSRFLLFPLLLGAGGGEFNREIKRYVLLDHLFFGPWLQSKQFQDTLQDQNGTPARQAAV